MSNLKASIPRNSIRGHKSRAVWFDIEKGNTIRHRHFDPISWPVLKEDDPLPGKTVTFRECVIELNKFKFGKYVYAIGFCMEEEKKYIARVYPYEHIGTPISIKGHLYHDVQDYYDEPRWPHTIIL